MPKIAETELHRLTLRVIPGDTVVDSTQLGRILRKFEKLKGLTEAMIESRRIRGINS